MYTCASCTVCACSHEHPQAMPKNCPMREAELVRASLEQYKVHPGSFEPMCNPILQAELLNR